MKILILSIIGFVTMADGSLRVTLKGGNPHSAIIVKGSEPYRFFREHVSKDSTGLFGQADAETLRMEFSNDTIVSLK